MIKLCDGYKNNLLDDERLFCIGMYLPTPTVVSDSDVLSQAKNVLSFAVEHVRKKRKRVKYKKKAT